MSIELSHIVGAFLLISPFAAVDGISRDTAVGVTRWDVRDGMGRF